MHWWMDITVETSSAQQKFHVLNMYHLPPSSDIKSRQHNLNLLVIQQCKLFKALKYYVNFAAQKSMASTVIQTI